MSISSVKCIKHHVYLTAGRSSVLVLLLLLVNWWITNQVHTTTHCIGVCRYYAIKSMKAICLYIIGSVYWL